MMSPENTTASNSEPRVTSATALAFSSAELLDIVFGQKALPGSRASTMIPFIRFTRLLCLLLCTGFCWAAGAATLIATNSHWKYLDNGTDQGTAWRDPSFDDSTWASGAAELGYGDGDEATVVSYGPNASARFTTTYFRRTIFVANASQITALTLRFIRDDGVIVYINGQEVARQNMPAGAVTYQTFASTAIGGTDESTYYTFNPAPSVLREGANVVAVEIHQSDLASSDISFNLDLTSTGGAGITRGPYLNIGTSDGVVVRWRTDIATDSRVRYGLSPTALNSAANDASATTEHEVKLTGLSANTKYYYTVGSSTNASTANDACPFFWTAPAIGTSKPTRIWAIGDFGTGAAGQRSVYNSFRAVEGTRYTDLWLMLGDIAYTSGTDAEFQSKVFDVYADLFRRTVVWPTIGNHEGVSASSATQSGPYYDVFTLPKSGQAGGLASGTEAYYSFDYGRIHFVCLDSEGSDRSTGGAMLTWLTNDLAATSQDWIIAYFHHPPYSKGSHDSDNVSDSGGRMTDMRQNALPILEAAGVDLVLCGHSHCYERSYLLNGHYGVSGTLSAAMKKDAGSGRPDGMGAYAKPVLGPSANQGAVYSVVGSAAQATGGSLNHPAHFVSLNRLGYLLIDVDGNRLDAKMYDDGQNILDYFTITKGALAPAQPTVRSFTNVALSTAQLTTAPTGTSPNTTGSVTATVNRSTGQLDYKLLWNGLTGAPTSVEFCGAAAPENTASALITVASPGASSSGSYSGSATLTNLQVSDLTAGLWYCNLKTAANSAGELRGQLTPDSASLKTVSFTGTPAADFGNDFRTTTSRDTLASFLTWDDTNLYLGFQGSAAYVKDEPTIIYIDTDPVQGSRALTSGSATPQNYDSRIPPLPFTANVVVYLKTTYAELRKNTGGTWSSATVLTGNLNTAGTAAIELRVPWILLPGGIRPASFNYCMMKENGTSGQTSAYMFHPASATTDDSISNINTAGLRNYASASMNAPYVPTSTTLAPLFVGGSGVSFLNAGATGGRVIQTRHQSGPSNNSFSGSATSPSGATVTPGYAATDRYWTITFDGTGAAGLSYAVNLDASSLPPSLNLDHCVVMKRDNGGPWTPANTTRNGTTLSASGFNSFSDFTVGSDAPLAAIIDWWTLD